MAAATRRRKTGQFSLSPRVLRRLLLVVPLALAAAWLSVAVSGSSIMRSVRPDLATRFQPFDARAQAKAAEQRFVQSQRRSSVDAAEQLALEALRRDVTVVTAWRTLGMVALARNQGEKAAQMFHFAGTVSRRDLPTQLWLIEESVQRNDIWGALRHYDAALRSTRASHDVLMPILVAATADNGIVRPLADLLNSSPPWRSAFMERLAREPPHPGNFVRLVEWTRRSAPSTETGLWALAMGSLVERRQIEPAWRLYLLLVNKPAAAVPLLRNGAFGATNRFPPFDWQLSESADLEAEQRSSGRGAGDVRLYAQAASGSGGTVARQLLMLPPGSYALNALAGVTEEVRPAQFSWRVSCADVRGRTLSEANFPPLGDRVPMRGAFQVPAGCPAQWIDLDIRPDFGPSGVGGWVDSVAIRRAGA